MVGCRLHDITPFQPHALVFSPFERLPSPADATATAQAPGTAARIADLLIATGLVAVEGRRTVNAPLDVAVRHERDGTTDRYEVLAGRASAAAWRPVLCVAFAAGRREVLRYEDGEWEERLLAWAFDGAGEATVVDDSPAVGGVRSEAGVIPGLQRCEPVSEAAIHARIMQPYEQEALKTLAWRVVLSGEVRLEERAVGALLLLRTWFDRSLWAHLQRGRRHTTHPDFATYCAMTLIHRDQCGNMFGDPAVVDRLAEVYGTEEGMRHGSSYWDGEGWRRAWADRHAGLRLFGPDDLPDTFPTPA